MIQTSLLTLVLALPIAGQAQVLPGQTLTEGGITYVVNYDNKSTVTVIGYDIAAGLNVVIPAFMDNNTLAVTSIRVMMAFRTNTAITSVTIPRTVSSIGQNAFYQCTSLTNVTIADGVSSIGQEAFYQCTSLTSVNIPGSVTSIDGDAHLATVERH